MALATYSPGDSYPQDLDSKSLSTGKPEDVSPETCASPSTLSPLCIITIMSSTSIITTTVNINITFLVAITQPPLNPYNAHLLYESNAHTRPNRYSQRVITGLV